MHSVTNKASTPTNRNCLSFLWAENLIKKPQGNLCFLLQCDCLEATRNFQVRHRHCVHSSIEYIYVQYIYLRHTQQLILKFTKLSATSSMATCFGHPCDHQRANFYRTCAFNVLTIWDPIMCTSFFICGLKSLLKVFTVRFKKNYCT